MDDLIEALSRKIPQTREPVKTTVGDVLRRRMEDCDVGSPEDIPSEIVLCPYVRPVNVAGIGAEDKVCKYYWVTGEMPDTLNCYICRK